MDPAGGKMETSTLVLIGAIALVAVLVIFGNKSNKKKSEMEISSLDSFSVPATPVASITPKKSKKVASKKAAPKKTAPKKATKSSSKKK